MTERRIPETSPRIDPEGPVNVRVERTGEGTVYRAEPRYVTETRPGVEQYATATPAGDRIRWGPILAGLITTVAAMLVLTVLGLAVGLSAFEPTAEGEDIGTAAALWAAVSALISFFLGGWVTGKTAALRGDDQALLNGVMVGATALALILWLASTGVGNLLGGLGTNIDEIANVGVEQSIDRGTAEAAAQNVRDAAVARYDEARNGAWGTLGGLVLALAAAAAGGLAGHKSRDHHDAVDRATVHTERSV